MTSFSASYSFCSSVISSIGFGIGSSTWPVMGLILEQVGQLGFNACVSTGSHGSNRRNEGRWRGLHTRVLQICTPPCPSPRPPSTESLLSLLPEDREPPGVPLRSHIQYTSTGSPLQKESAATGDEKMAWAAVELLTHPRMLSAVTHISHSPLSLQRTKRNSAEHCFTPVSTCVIRRTNLFLRVVPISGLIFTSFRGGST